MTHHSQPALGIAARTRPQPDGAPLDDPGHRHDDHDHGHGHGPVDRSVLRSKAGLRAVSLSLAILTATALVQTAIYARTLSVALLADLIHNFGDAATAIPLGLAFFFRSVRGERLAGLAVVFAIFASACVALVQTIERFIDPRELSHLWLLAAAGVVGFLGNEVAARIRTRAGRRLNSAALVADGNHARVDGFVSLGVLVSAAVVGLGLPIADPIIGLAITVVILHITWQSWRTIRAWVPTTRHGARHAGWKGRASFWPAADPNAEKALVELELDEVVLPARRRDRDRGAGRDVPDMLAARNHGSLLLCGAATTDRRDRVRCDGAGPQARYAHAMTSNLPLVACSLDATDQQTRLADWAQLLGQARRREETPDGLRYTFASDEELKTRVETLADAERKCCSFLEFEITEPRDDLELTVKAPPDGQEALRFIFSA